MYYYVKRLVTSRVLVRFIELSLSLGLMSISWIR